MFIWNAEPSAMSIQSFLKRSKSKIVIERIHWFEIGGNGNANQHHQPHHIPHSMRQKETAITACS